MKKIIIPLFLLFFSISIIAQPSLDFGLKAGLNNSKVTLNMNEIDAESILKYHIGAFGRIGFGRIFIQPEAYFSAKGGDLEGNILDIASGFDFNTVDVPLLLGFKIIEGERANLRLMAGPAFSILTSKKIEGGDFLDPRYYENHYFAFQYGIGADFLGFTLDLKMENGANNFYQQSNPDLDGKNNIFMISVGYKIF
jgi:hypothetical protein